jgi:hypothetical protein
MYVGTLSERKTLKQQHKGTDFSEHFFLGKFRNFPLKNVGEKKSENFVSQRNSAENSAELIFRRKNRTKNRQL